MLREDSGVYYAAGGMGDLCITTAKFVSSGLSKSARFVYYTAQESTARIGPRFLELQGVKGEVIQDADYVTKIKAIRDQNVTINTVWNGESYGPLLEECNPDGHVVPARFDLKGENIADLPNRYFTIQIHSGFSPHHHYKNWNDFGMLHSVGNLIGKSFNLRPVAVGVDGLTVPSEWLNTEGSGLGVLTYIRHAKFHLGLSSFLSLASLMLGVPTIYKKEPKQFDDHYFGHPDWHARALRIEELSDLKLIKKYVERSCD